MMGIAAPYRWVLVAVIVAVVGYVALGVVRMVVLARKSAVLVKASVPFERTVEGATTTILVLGDSTAVGTGAKDPAKSTAGRIGALHPEVNVHNLARNGMRVKEFRGIVEGLDPNERYSIVVAQIGANDVIRQTDLAEVERDVDAAMGILATRADEIILLHSGDIGESFFFPAYLRPLMTKRSYALREAYLRIAAKHGISYVNLIDAPWRETIKDDPDTYYASDMLHLNDTGYGLWFDEIAKVL